MVDSFEFFYDDSFEDYVPSIASEDDYLKYEKHMTEYIRNFDWENNMFRLSYAIDEALKISPALKVKEVLIDGIYNISRHARFYISITFHEKENGKNKFIIVKIINDDNFQ